MIATDAVMMAMSSGDMATSVLDPVTRLFSTSRVKRGIGYDTRNHTIRKTANHSQFFLMLAVGVGFEPTEPLGSLVFKTSAFGHSATPPGSGRHRPAATPPDCRAAVRASRVSIPQGSNGLKLARVPHAPARAWNRAAFSH